MFGEFGKDVEEVGRADRWIRKDEGRRGDRDG